MFSKACEYAIRSVIFLTSKSKLEQRFNITDISEEIDAPTAFNAKILQKLVKADIVSSAKGPTGGFYITEEKASGIMLSNIVKTIDGDDIYVSCGIGLKKCNAEKPCPLHDSFQDIRNNLKTMLQETSLKNLADQIEDGTAVLKL
ncbi:RrF2 family transcriptional regulator [Patiriisocius marinus]|uniref:Transcriptional regulator, BadM/Rrf2 family n=1 Tax=Patiriisocius marinus TaxID=1397112 RepID=A0A5J4J1F1_9FLAO|nr:Rrf2 family transcriptional regulator [Patiriisocius marinus]GER60712.1 hypothetical protein ULMA_28200 [Patiriisocius marinus]